MLKWLTSMLCLLFGAGCALDSGSGDREPDISPIRQQVIKAGLPVYGSFLKSPMQEDKWYYYTGQWMFERMNGTGRGSPYGLWFTENNGGDWRRLSSIPDFIQVLIHPRSLHLYAIIGDWYYKKDQSGFLDKGVGYKVIVSENNYDWIDITPSGEYLFHDAEPIFPDPDSETGVCVYQQTDGVMWRTSAEKPIKWRKYSMEEWVKQHPDWTYDDMMPDGIRGGTSAFMDGERISDHSENE